MSISLIVFVRPSLYMRREENQLDVTECFIALMIRLTCFGHFYAHNQELETICVLLPPMVCSAWLLVVGSQVQAAGYESRERDVSRQSRATSLSLFRRRGITQKKAYNVY